MFEEFVKRANENPKDIDKIFSDFLKELATVKGTYLTKASILQHFVREMSDIEFKWISDM